ncbi:MAG TPA: PQQ-binding-like beta-propeller repeat protein [Kofleriaceae bacterium]|nr:PQQ-binding-like beta-propeller repeat protein [Kofleriaceae bacterium]
MVTRLMMAGAVLIGACGGGKGDATHRARADRSEPPLEALADQEPAALDLAESGEDVLAEARQINADTPPPETMRPGHVTRKLGPSSVTTAGATGFSVQLPSRAPVPTPVVTGDLVVVSGGFKSRDFYAFDARTGAQRWAIDLSDDGPSTAACAEGVCVFNTESCTTFAVDAATGEQKWSWWLGDPQLAAPAISNGRVFAAYPAAAPYRHATTTTAGTTYSHGIGAFELHTGTSIWHKWIDADVMSSPVAVGGRLYFTTFAGTVYKLDQATGEILSARRDRATSAPVVVGRHVYYTRRTDGAGDPAEEGVVRNNMVTGENDWVRAKKAAPYLDAKVQRGSTYWSQGVHNDTANGFGAGAPATAKAGLALDIVGQGSVSTLQAFQGSRVLAFGNSNIITMGDEVVATDARRGTRLWSHKLEGDVARSGGFLASPPAAAGYGILVGTLAGKVLLLEPETGKTLAQLEVGSPVRAQPIAHEGWIYVGTEDGRLVAIDTKNPRVTGWTHWGGDAARTGVR